MYAWARNGDDVAFDLPFAQPRPGEHFKGKVFLLIDRQSYSNAVSVAALVQDYKFGTVLGEETSDMATTYGAMEQFRLPNTGIMVGYPKAYIIRPNGDTRPRGVTPDVPIRTPVVQSPADEVLRKAVTIVQGSKSSYFRSTAN
jgi:C-terminal processing protease CtpA/Prc